MKFAVFGRIVLATRLPCALAGEVAGTWEGTFTKDAKAFYAGFDLDVAGERITGAAFVQGWDTPECPTGA